MPFYFFPTTAWFELLWLRRIAAGSLWVDFIFSIFGIQNNKIWNQLPQLCCFGWDYKQSKINFPFAFHFSVSLGYKTTKLNFFGYEYRTLVVNCFHFQYLWDTKQQTKSPERPF